MTNQVSSGSIGANLQLRDTILPQAQAGLDEFTEALASRLQDQGLALFAQPDGTVPSGGGTPVQSGYIGFAGTVTVNPTVVARPSLVRDGTNAGQGGASAFTPVADGPAGSTTLIDRVLTYGFGSTVQAGVAQAARPFLAWARPGAISLGFQPGATLADFVAGLVGAQAQQASAASDTLSTGQALQSSLQAKVQATSGVSIDTELSTMIALQNSYGANAKVIGAVQAMWTDLFDAVTATA